MSRKNGTEWTIELAEQWIARLAKLHGEGYLDDPSGLWNLDESAFHLAEVWKRVLAVKGTKKVTSHIDADPKERLTVLACGNAAGKMLDPFVLFDGMKQLGVWTEGTADKCCVGVNKSGWMDCIHFTNYVKHFLLPAMTAKKV